MIKELTLKSRKRETPENQNLCRKMFRKILLKLFFPIFCILPKNLYEGLLFCSVFYFSKHEKVWFSTGFEPMQTGSSACLRRGNLS